MILMMQHGDDFRNNCPRSESGDRVGGCGMAERCSLSGSVAGLNCDWSTAGCPRRVNSLQEKDYAST